MKDVVPEGFVVLLINDVDKPNQVFISKPETKSNILKFTRAKYFAHKSTNYFANSELNAVSNGRTSVEAATRLKTDG